MVHIIPAHAGLPDITILVTGDENEAARFIKDWAGSSNFGLDLEWRPTYQKGQYSRVATLQVCAGPWVLVFDLTARRRKQLQHLPDVLWYFLENDEHWFYGMGLVEDAARLAFEFDCIIAGIDFAQGKAWPEMIQLGGGLEGLANRVLGTTVQQSAKITRSNWDARPLSEKQLQYCAEDAYLSWALAMHFMERELPHENWLISMAEVYGRGQGIASAGYSIPDAVHDWELARQEYEEIQLDKKRTANAKKNSLRTLKRQKEQQEQQQGSE